LFKSLFIYIFKVYETFYFFCVLGGFVQKSKGVFFISSHNEKDYFFATSDSGEFFKKKNASSFLYVRKNNDFVTTFAKKVNFIDFSNNQNTSVGTSLIPYLEHDDANRALMGSNMQRQALPLKIKESSLIETGVERQISKVSELNISTINSGVTAFSNFKKIIIFSDLVFNKSLKSLNFDELDVFNQVFRYKCSSYFLNCKKKSNQSNILFQDLRLKKRDWVNKGDFLVNESGTFAGKVCAGNKFRSCAERYKILFIYILIISFPKIYRKFHFISKLYGKSFLFEYYKVYFCNIQFNICLEIKIY